MIRLNKGCKTLSFHTALIMIGESFASSVFVLCDAESRSVSIDMESDSGQKYLKKNVFKIRTRILGMRG